MAKHSARCTAIARYTGQRCRHRATPGATVCPSHGARASSEQAPEQVNHPRHYTSHPAGIECIDVIEWFTPNIANAVKYLWRHGQKAGQDADVDLRKAVWYIERERQRLQQVPAS